MSFQITVLKVLEGHPGGCASHTDVTRSVAILISSDVDWSQRMKRLAARAPNLDMYSGGYVIRDNQRVADQRPWPSFPEVDRGVGAQAGAQTRGFARPVVSVPPDLEPNVVKLVDHQDAGAPLLDYIRVAQAVAVGRDV
ncbi:hypothetical protein [Bradyrhizobium sp. JYMT SZCCT0180]|uniref:hypothetical protein n=1 Tax=Bradyrhizobium sp. JYMT SZCCT0180 TaxID=2807666 RepID=UPI001BADCC76|nr:hypothetical protein [Bradyrhizobium sp. JYMT SZCCT0180]MBR1211291.1 hypothetical protein [Bradyrhizobium sp. JYMT SZCCT0180]